MRNNPDLRWLDLKNALKNTDRKELINIIQDLYRYSEENRRYLLARCMDTSVEPGILKAYRKVIKNEFFPKKGYGALRYSVAKKAISDYSKASGDFAGTMELMLFYVENGVEFTSEYGDIDEEFYQEIYSAFEEFCTRLETPEGKTLYVGFRERLLKIRRKTKGVAWGFGDGIKLRVKEIEDFFEDAQSDS
jgi:hypothetical protein